MLHVAWGRFLKYQRLVAVIKCYGKSKGNEPLICSKVKRWTIEVVWVLCKTVREWSAMISSMFAKEGHGKWKASVQWNRAMGLRCSYSSLLAWCPGHGPWPCHVISRPVKSTAFMTGKRPVYCGRDDMTGSPPERPRQVTGTMMLTLIHGETLTCP